MEKEVTVFHSEGDLFLSPGTYPPIMCVYVLICFCMCGNKVTKIVPIGAL